MQKILINELFYSIQGESSYAGFPTSFIRTTGCNLRCNYCDTTYSFSGGENKTFDELLDFVKSHKTKYVCITGGEPLLQKNMNAFLKLLCDENYKVSLETNGAVSIKDVDSRVKIILDVKTPDSGAENSFDFQNLKFCNVNTEFKFVICSENDFDWAENFVQEHQLLEHHEILYSPSFSTISEKWLAKKMLLQESSARLHLQQHKYIWSPNIKGV